MAVNVEQQGDVIKLNGPITFATVVALKQRGEKYIAKGASLHFDFSGVNDCDSSALALLIAWKRAAKRQEVAIDFIHVPKSLCALSTLCNAKSIIEN